MSGKNKRPIHPNLGQRVAAIRTKRGITQRQLARQLGITEQTIQNWEHGRHNIPVARIRDLAHALGCEEAEFLLPTSAPIPPRSRLTPLATAGTPHRENRLRGVQTDEVAQGHVLINADVVASLHTSDPRL